MDKNMWTEKKLDELLTTPSQGLVDDMKNIKGDIIILGAGGKMGPTLAILAKNAAAAAGIDTARGDKLVVEAIEFPAEEAPAKMPIAASVGKYLGLGRNALAMLMLAVFLFFVKGALSRQTISIEAERTALEGTEGQPLSAQEGSPRTLLKGADPELTMPLESAKELAKSQPEEIAGVVRTWMSDEKRAA